MSKRKNLKMPTVWELLTGKPRRRIFPNIPTNTVEGRREYQRRYMKLVRDRKRQRAYSPRKRTRKKGR